MHRVGAVAVCFGIGALVVSGCGGDGDSGPGPLGSGAEAFAAPTVEIDDPRATDLDEWCSTGIHVGFDHEVYDRNGPTGDLGAFAYTQQPDGTWAVADYNTDSCG